MGNKLKVVYGGFIKFFLLVLLAMLCLAIVFSVTYYDISRTGVISDSSLTEAVQEGLLFFCVCAFVYIAKKYKADGVLMVAGFLACMLIREWDVVFDKLLFHGGWKFIAVPAAVLACYFALRGGKEKAVADLAYFMQRKSYNVLVLGMTMVLVISRILGMRMIVMLYAGISFNEGLKNFMEEGSELMGYLVIFIATLLYLLEYRQLHKAGPKH